MNPFQGIYRKIVAEAAASREPVAKKNRRWSGDRKLRITKGRKGGKLGNGHLSHDREGRELAAIEDVNAGLRKESGLDFEVDEAEPRKLNYLTRRQLERAYAAMMFLHCKGIDFNFFYTCTWASVELTTDEEVDETIRLHVEHLRHWVTEEKGEKGNSRFYYIWAVERGENRGLHFHMLFHLPRDVDLEEFEHEVEQSIFTLTGMRPRRPAAVRGKSARRGKAPKRGKGAEPVETKGSADNPLVAVGDTPAETEVDDTMTVHIARNKDVDEQWFRWRYLFGGIDPNEGVHVRGHGRRKRTPIHRYLGLRYFSHQGRYGGLRLGISQWLGPKQRRIFARMNGMPPNPLWTAKDPSELYGSQFLDFAKALAERKPEPEPKVKLLRSLEPDT